MSDVAAGGQERAVFAHQLRAMLARQRREDIEAVAGSLRRSGFQVQLRDEKRRRGTLDGPPLPRGDRTPDFSAASPLTGRDRQSGKIRIPHFDIKPIVAARPPSKDGKVTTIGTRKGMSAGQHFDYVVAGGVVSYRTHYDYIRRETGRDDPAGELCLDALDEQELRGELNQLAYFTNIPGDVARQRSLFEAAEKVEPPPKTYRFKLSTADLPTLDFAVRLAQTPNWVRAMRHRLREQKSAAEEDADSRGRTFRDHQVTVAEGTSAQVFDWLEWFNEGPHMRCDPGWEQGRSGRHQTRFVGELPNGLSALERNDVLVRFCDSLADEGWMVAGAIHMPDRTNDRRNYHLHVDGYDRPARWLEEADCWDFAHEVRKNGKDTFPNRQNKVRYAEPPTRVLRERFIEIVNAVVGDRHDVVQYVAGTYADNGIALNALEHMGPRAIALEKRGVATAVGSRNAGRIFADQMAACERKVTDATAALTSEVELTRPMIAGDAGALAALDRYERLEKRRIARQLQRELADIAVAMAKSRAEAVIAAHTSTPGVRVKPRAGDANLIAAAYAHLAAIEQAGPTIAEREAEHRTDTALEKRAAVCWELVQDAQTVAARGMSGRDFLAYQPKHPTPLAERPTDPRHDKLVRQRLHAWLDKHAADRSRLIVADSGVRLGAAVPKAIDTLLKRFAHEPTFQRRLWAERDRRWANDVLCPKGARLPIRRAQLADLRSVVAAHPMRSVRTTPIQQNAADRKIQHHDRPGKADRKAVSNSDGLRGLAGLRDLHELPMDGRRRAAEGVLHDLQLPDVRVGGTNDRSVRGTSDHRLAHDVTHEVASASHSPSVAPAKTGPTDSDFGRAGMTPESRAVDSGRTRGAGGLFGQAAGLSAANGPAKSKGPAGPAKSPTRGKGPTVQRDPFDRGGRGR